MAEAPTRTCSVCQRDVHHVSRGMCGNCYRIWQKDNLPPNATCDVCGKAYFRRPGASPKGRTCSRSCFSLWKHGHDCFNRPTDGGVLVERTCPVCRTGFVVEKRQVKKGFGRYCSLQCNAIRRRIDPERSTYPENAWRQREGFRALSDGMLSVPDSRCQLCGERRTAGNLVVHHPTAPDGDRELLLAPGNLVVLCRACHMRVHHHGLQAEVA